MKKTLYLLMALVLIITPFAYYQNAKADIYGSSLVGWWTLDSNDISGTSVTDKSGTGNTGTTVNGPTAVTGELGQALNFSNASTQYVNVSDATSLNPTAVTYSAWVKGTTFPNAYNAIMHKGNNIAYTEYYIKSNGTIAVYLQTTGGGGGSSYDGTGSITLSTGKWYLVTFTYNSTSGIVGYVNGKVDSTAASTGTITSSAGTPLSIGRDSFTSGRNFDGVIDDARVYNRALSAADVQQLYYAGLARHGGF